MSGVSIATYFAASRKAACQVTVTGSLRGRERRPAATERGPPNPKRDVAGLRATAAAQPLGTGGSWAAAT